MQTLRRIACLSLVALIGGGALIGCRGTDYWKPRGPGVSRDRFTYASTTWSPKTVTLTDHVTGEQIWSVDVPVGQKATVWFKEGDGPSDRYPDMMHWVVQRADRYSDTGASRMPVPPAEARLLSMEIRPAPERPEEQVEMSEPAPMPEDDTNGETAGDDGMDDDGATDDNSGG